MHRDLDVQGLTPAHLPSDTMDSFESTCALKEELRQARAQLQAVSQRLAHSEAMQSLLRSTLDACEDGMVASQVDGPGIPILYNPAFSVMWGLDQDTLNGMDSDELRDALCEQVKHPAELARQVSQFDPDSEDASVVELKDGRIFERHGCPQRVSGRSVGRVIVYRDVTNRVQFERKMMFNQAVIESSGPILWVDYKSGDITYGNPAALELLGYRADEIIGMNIAQLDAGYTVDRAKGWTANCAARANPRSLAA